MAKREPLCPLFKKPCIEHECNWYTHVQGMHPQTGQVIDQYGCAVTWVPILAIELSKTQRETGAAVESFRNETLRLHQESLSVQLRGAIPHFDDYKVPSGR